MAGISDIINIGRSGLLSFQQGMTTVSHNITNQTTEGYSKQNANFVTGPPQGGLIPTGVRVASVTRNVDQFIEKQLTTTTGEFGRIQARSDMLQQLQGVLPETDSQGISQDLADFFNALRDVSNSPENQANRTVLLNKTQTLTTALNQASTSLSDLRANIDGTINQDLSTVNSLASQIASLNGQIQEAEAGGQPANDLRDKRGKLVNDLTKLVGGNVIEMTDGLNVNVGGQLLVSGSHANSLVQVIDSDNSNLHQIAVKRSDNSTVTITSQLTEGKLKGLLDVRDSQIVDAQDRLDRLAGVLINEVNQQHEAGYGLDGTTGNALFSALSPPAPRTNENNSGGAQGTSTSILTPSALTMDTYEIRFTSASQFNVVDVTNGTTVLSAQSYTSGANIDFDGLRVVITNGTSPPANGDIFTVSAHQGAAGGISVSLTDPDKVAASSTAAGVPGNNVNAEALINIQAATQSTLGNVTMEEYHAATVAGIGSETQEANSQMSVKQAELDQVQSLRDGVSGVNLDEELANLLSYQRAYQASARVITTADQMFQTVLAMGQ